MDMDEVRRANDFLLKRHLDREKSMKVVYKKPVRARGLPDRARTSAAIGMPTPKNNPYMLLFDPEAELPYGLDWETMEYVETVAKYNPDMSQAIDNIKSLANSGHELFVTAGSKLKTRRIREMLEEKASLIQERNGGVDGLIDKLLVQSATYGAMCGEVVLSGDLTQVVDFVDLNPRDIRFFWDNKTQRYMPYQKLTMAQAQEAREMKLTIRNDCIPLNEMTFMYYSFNAAPNSPYGVPPFLSAMANLSLQRDLMFNMAQVVKKLGVFALVDMTIDQVPQGPDEQDEAYFNRTQNRLAEFAEQADYMAESGGIVHYDDVKVETQNLVGNAAGATAIFKQNEEMAISGMHTNPAMLGRCMDPETPVLMFDGSTKKLKDVTVGDSVLGFDEHRGREYGGSGRRHWREARVTNAWAVKKQSVRLTLSNGKSVLCSEDHPFLMQLQKSGSWGPMGADSAFTSETGKRASDSYWGNGKKPSVRTDWYKAGDIRPGHWIKAIPDVPDIDHDSDDYKAGYIAGANAGDGWYNKDAGGRGYAKWSLAVCEEDVAIIDRVHDFAVDLGVDRDALKRYVRQPAVATTGFQGCKPMAFVTSHRDRLSRDLIDLHESPRDTPEYMAGWLAGMFDTDGNLDSRERNKSQMRFCQNDGENKDRIEKYLTILGVEFTSTSKSVTVRGDRFAKWRLSRIMGNVLPRKQVGIEGISVYTTAPVRVESVERVGEQELIDVTTTTATFVGNSLLTHNSYSTTETYAGVAYDILLRSVRNHQRPVKRMIERIYRLQCQLSGQIPDKIEIRFNDNKTLQRLQNAQAFRTELQNALILWMSGIYDQGDFAQSAGINSIRKPLTDPPETLYAFAGGTVVADEPQADNPPPPADDEGDGDSSGQTAESKILDLLDGMNGDSNE